MKSPGPEETWTDGLPVCYLSGVGFSTNQRYREDGHRQEEHPCEDKSFHFKLGDNTYLYGVFDGHCTDYAADVASQRIPAELALGQLQGATSGEEVKAILYQAIRQAEKEFFVSIGDLLAERTSLQMELHQYGNQYEAVKHAPDKMRRLEVINSQICSGTSALVALVHNDMLYFASIGTSRALLCQMDGSVSLRVRCFTVDHTVDNEGELARLAALGLSIEQLYSKKKLVGNQVYTRCLGDYSVKGGYRQFFESLSAARSEPVIAEPEIQGGIPLDGSAAAFLVLMSDGVYTALEHATSTKRVNLDMASMVASEFNLQSTLNGVAQAVIDRIVRLHHDAYVLAPPDDEHKRTCQRHDDMTLLVRSFGYPMRHHVIGSSRGGGGGNSWTVGPSSPLADSTLEPPLGVLPTASAAGADGSVARQSSRTAATITSTLTSLIYRYGVGGDHDDRSAGGSSDGGDEDRDGSQDSGGTLGRKSDDVADPSTSLEQTMQSLGSLKLDSEGRVEAYVSFAEYVETFDRWSDEEKHKFEELCSPRMDHDSIAEVVEPTSPEPSVK